MAIKVGYFDYNMANPFQHRFFGALEKQGLSVTSIQQEKLLSPSQLRPFDIVHFDWLHPFYKNRRRLIRSAKLWATTYALKNAKRPKFFHTFHNTISHDSFISKQQEERIVGRILEHMDAMIGFSEATLHVMRSIYPQTLSIPQFVVPHGHYIDDYEQPVSKALARKMLGITTNKPLVLFFGGLRSNKGITDLLKVFPDVVKKTDAHLLVAGSGAGEADARHLNEKLPWLTFHDELVSDDFVHLYYSCSDVVVLPFRDILNSGSSILGASMGKCMVLPKFDSLIDPLYKESLFTYEPNNLSDLTRALRQATSTPGNRLHELGLEARADAQDRMCWDRIGSSMRKIYQTILNNA